MLYKSIIVFVQFLYVASTCFVKNDIMNSDKLFSYKGNVYDSSDYRHPGGQNDIAELVGNDLESFVNTKSLGFHLKSNSFYMDLEDMLVGQLDCTTTPTTPSETPTRPSETSTTASETPTTASENTTIYTETTISSIDIVTTEYQTTKYPTKSSRTIETPNEMQFDPVFSVANRITGVVTIFSCIIYMLTL